MKTTLIAIPAVLVFSACTTVNHTVRIPTVTLATPVSASGYFVSKDGAVHAPTDYAVKQHFTFQKELACSDIVNGDDAIDLGPLLSPAIQTNSADAVVNLQLYGMQYTNGIYPLAGVTRNLGVMGGLAGALVYVGGVVGSSYGGGMDGMKSAGLYVGLAGAGLIVTSFIMQALGTSTWTVGGEGDAVALTK